MFLTFDELVELTHRAQHRKQASACAEMGVPYRVRPDGSVAVARSLFDIGKQPATMHSGTPRLRLQHGTPKND